MLNLGDVAAGTTIRIPFNTTAIAGESITIGTNGTIAVYKDGSTTERTSASGITFVEDHDGHTGTHEIAIDLSDNTDAGFYAAGSIYKVKYHTATIDGKAVSAWVALFTIDKTRNKVDVRAWGGDSSDIVTDINGHPVVYTYTIYADAITAIWAAATRTITGGTVTTVNDKSGYSLTQAFPTNFSALGINASGHVDRVTLTDAVTTVNGLAGSVTDAIETAVGVTLTSYKLNQLVLNPAVLVDVNSDSLIAMLASTLAFGNYDRTTDSLEAQAATQATILADTNELQGDWVNGGRLDNLLDGRATPAQVNDEVLDVISVDTLIDGKTLAVALKIIAAMVGGKVSGATAAATPDTLVFLGIDGTTTRVTIESDVNGNRTSATYA